MYSSHKGTTEIKMQQQRKWNRRQRRPLTKLNKQIANNVYTRAGISPNAIERFFFGDASKKSRRIQHQFTISNNCMNAIFTNRNDYLIFFHFFRFLFVKSSCIRKNESPRNASKKVQSILKKKSEKYGIQMTTFFSKKLARVVTAHTGFVGVIFFFF